MPSPVPYHAQGVEVPGTKRPGQTGHYINGLFGYLDPNDPSHLNTLPQAFEAGLEYGPDRPCLGHRPLVTKSPLKFADTYVWQSYAEIDVRRRAVGSALEKLFSDGTLDVGTGELQCVGVWAPNCPEWQIVDFACNAYKKVTVSLYDTLGDDSVEYIINHAHLPVTFCTLEHIPSLLKLKGTNASVPLKYIISVDEIPAQVAKVLDSWGRSVGIQVVSFKQFEELGKQNLINPIPAQRDQVASICYTSGTTGNPKGVVITHLMMSMAVQGNLCGLDFEGGEAVLLSYLPLAHIYERLCSASTFAVAGRVGYFSGDHLRLLEDAQVLQPSFFPSVPRVLNRVYQAGMVAANAPGLKGVLFRKAMAAKVANLESGQGYKHAFWDKLVFRKLRAVLGGNVEMLVSGSAPVSREVMDFLKVAFSCAVQEGYGMTENCATCNRSYPDDHTSSGTVGPPQACNEVKLVDVPEMGYTSEDKPNPRGEVCVRGWNCFTTYYKDEVNTKKAVDEEGWVHTGDVGEIDSCGRLRIVDRVKNIMKLAQGEYVALEKIENIYSRHPLIQQLYVHGDGLQSYLIAVVVPDPIQLAAGVRAVTKKNISAKEENLESLRVYLQDPAVAEWVHRELNAHARKAGLKGFETVKRIHLSGDLFSVEAGTMTPTMKIKRKESQMKYKQELAGLYALGEPVSSAPAKM